MRAPWTALREARAEIDRETDERAELIRLRKERIELRAAALVAVVGLVFLSGRAFPRPPDDSVLPWPASMTVLLLVLLAWLAAHVVAGIRHGDEASPEAERADALRALILLPGGVALGGFFYWYTGQDLQSTLTWLAMFAPTMAIGLYLRYRWRKRDVELAAKQDEER